MIILGLILTSLYIKYIQKTVTVIGMDKVKEELQLNSLEAILGKVNEFEIPKIEMPKIDQETLQEFQKMMKEMPEQEIENIPEEYLKENNHNELAD